MAKRLYDQMDFTSYGAWVTPTGKVINVPSCEHSSVGSKYAKKYPEWAHLGTVYGVLYARGWARLCFNEGRELDIELRHGGPILRLIRSLIEDYNDEFPEKEITFETGAINHQPENFMELQYRPKFSSFNPKPDKPLTKARLDRQFRFLKKYLELPRTSPKSKAA